MSTRARPGLLIPVAMLCLIPSVARTELFVHVSSGRDLGVGGLKQYTLTAIGDQNEHINVFGSINLTGSVHQVGAFSGSPTPFVQALAWGPADSSWRDFDTHLLFLGSEMIGWLGTPLIEANDRSTEGALGLTPMNGLDPASGFGSLTTENGALGLFNHAAGDRVPFLQVVTASTAFLDIEIVGYHRNTGNATPYNFSGISIGDSYTEATFSGEAWYATPPPSPVKLAPPVAPKVDTIIEPVIDSDPEIESAPPPLETIIEPDLDFDSEMESAPPPLEAPNIGDVSLPVEISPDYLPGMPSRLDGPYDLLRADLAFADPNFTTYNVALPPSIGAAPRSGSYITFGYLQSANATVPEPHGIFLAAIAFGSFFMRRRRVG